MPDKVDVAVIGAGMAGAIAARNLTQKGLSVALLEARDRVGGRTYVGKVFGEDLELGGTYVHWTQPHVWSEIQRHNLIVKPPITQGDVYWLANGTVHSGTHEEYYQASNPVLTRFFADATARFPKPYDVTAVDNKDAEQETIEDRVNSLQLSPYDRDVLKGTLAGIVHSYGAHGVTQLLHGVATYFGDYRSFYETAGRWSIQGGTKALIEAILNESTAELRLSTPVSSVKDDGSQVIITTRAGQTLSAHSVILTLPVNTLGDVQITPPLPPAVRTMIDQKNPVMAGKLWVLAKGEIPHFSAYAPAGKHPLNVIRTERYHKGDTFIVCMVSDAAAISPNDLGAIQTALRKFVPDIKVVNAAWHNWCADEFSKGGWMIHRPGHMTVTLPHIWRPHGRIYFAGSDIAALNLGSIEGAMQSGAAAARDVTASFFKSKF
ncbi:hypothetical protein PHISCL_02397 [Aspergillus sclerotialis]|uniref:Amine oxidase n=1 Tax=Aspergillus sclerotialis TaxID=2070753 RepID=A0A3A2ZV53_9EURO|nr:hypothetical protein PHISCL_02397 [Aspergillus sclerotialis]